MYCKKCGADLEDNANFCPDCGRKIQHKTLKLFKFNKNTILCLIIVLLVLDAIGFGILIYQKVQSQKHPVQEKKSQIDNDTASIKVKKKKTEETPEESISPIPDYTLDYKNTYRTLITQIRKDYIEKYGQSTFLNYCVYDMDSDAIEELFVRVGTSEADAIWKIYSYDIATGEAYSAGEFSGSHTGLYAPEDNDSGIIAVCGHMGVHSAYHIRRINKTEITMETLIDNQFVEDVENYYSTPYPMDYYSVDDLRGLGEVTPKDDYYAPVLQQYSANRYTTMPGEYTLEENYLYVNQNAFCDNGMLPDSLCYTLLDLNGDDIKELVIAYVPYEEPDHYVVYDIYTIQDDAPKRLLDISDMGIYSFYYLCQDNCIFKVERSETSHWYGNLFYQMESGSSTLTFIDGVWIYPTSSIETYYNKSEYCEEEDSEAVDEEYYKEMLNRHPLNTNINWNPVYE